MDFQVRITEAALADLEGILAYSWTHFPATAERFGNALLNHIDMLRSFPYIGSPVALVLPVLLAFLELEPLSRPLSVLALLVLSQFVINNFLEPRLTARAVDLSPLVVLIALAFWGLCWGVVGMVLAVPLTVVLKIVWERIPLTRPLARLMAEG